MVHTGRYSVVIYFGWIPPVLVEQSQHDRPGQGNDRFLLQKLLKKIITIPYPEHEIRPIAESFLSARRIHPQIVGPRNLSCDREVDG